MLQGTFDFNNPVRHITAKAELLCDSSAPATKSGNPIVITDATEQPHQVVITTTPGAEVKRFGKNLLPNNSWYHGNSYTGNGITYTTTGKGELHISGTPTGMINYWLYTNGDIVGNSLIDGITYKVLFEGELPSGATVMFYFQYKDENGNNVYKYNGQTFTWSKNYTVSYVFVSVPSTANNLATTFNNTIYPMLVVEKATEEWEEYKEPQTAIADENGKVDGIISLPNMTLITDSANTMTVNYQIPIEGDNHTFTHDSNLISIKVDRLGESKFFGFGVGQKANIKVIDRERTCAPTTANYAVIYFNDVRTLPNMYVSEVHRDENTNEVSITLYDRLYDAAAHTVSELNLTSYTIGEFAAACAMLLGVRISLPALPEFETSYTEGANFEGTETLREALNDVAEATQTIYYINADNELVFKRLDKDGVPAYTIDKSQYITLDSKTNRRLTSIVSATELGDNVEATTGLTGTTQYVRDNAFWDLHEDRTALVENALAALANFTINQFDCSWRGNYLLEPGDKLALIAKDNSEVHSFLLDDSITYNGAFKQRTQWIYEDEDEEHTNPTSLGDMLKQTFAKVDKANKQIELVVSEVDELSRITMNTSEIEATVGRIETTTNNALDSINEELIEINNKVNTSITSEEVEILISEKLSGGVNSVETATGFTFDEKGLTISKSESEISTTITEDGMTIDKNGDEMLTANNQGVKAKDLHATTYLIIGTNSRFEDIGSTRTACYWIGG